MMHGSWITSLKCSQAHQAPGSATKNKKYLVTASLNLTTRMTSGSEVTDGKRCELLNEAVGHSPVLLIASFRCLRGFFVLFAIDGPTGFLVSNFVTMQQRHSNTPGVTHMEK